MLDAQKRLSLPFKLMLSLPATGMGFALSAQIAALSWILTTQYGLHIEEVGLVWAAGPLAGILGQVIIGAISDKTWFWGGRRKPFIFLGGLIAAPMLLALPNLDSIGSTLGLEALLGIAIIVALSLDLAINVSFNPARSVIADVTPVGEKRTSAYTWMQFVSGSFGVLAYAVGASFGNITLVYFAAVLVLVFSLVPPLFIEEPREIPVDDSEEDTFNFGTAVSAIKPLWGFALYAVYAIPARVLDYSPGHHYFEILALAITLWMMGRAVIAKDNSEDSYIGFRKVATANALSWIGVQTMFVYMIAYIQTRMPHLSDDEVGQVMNIGYAIMWAVAAVVPVLVLRPIAYKISSARTMAVCTLVMALAYATISLAVESVMALYVLMAVLGFGVGGVVSLPFDVMSQKAKAHRLGLFMGLFNLSIVLPQLFVSLAIGIWIGSMEDQSMLFLICGTALLLSSIAWARIEK